MEALNSKEPTSLENFVSLLNMTHQGSSVHLDGVTKYYVRERNHDERMNLTEFTLTLSAPT